MQANKKGIDIFLQISSALTGFSQEELLATGMVETYFNVAVNSNSLLVAESFFSDAAEILKFHGEDEVSLNEEILRQLIPDCFYNGLAKNIITVWYTGRWEANVISPQTFVEGLIWGIADSHPPGAKQPGYGSWSDLPISAQINNRNQ